ncbi:AMP-dependent synthetase ligase domain containing protein [Aphelenchoides fujianensis]|nr:AMP-dependent synthetase ligase domain containing protein [Aphelenchoides fujianensis]
MVGAKDASLWVLPVETSLSGRLTDLAEWASNSTQSTIVNAVGESNASLVYSFGAAAAVGMGLYWLTSPSKEGRVKPIVDLNSQTRVLPDGSRVCKYLQTDNLVKTLHSDKSNNGPMLGHRVKQADGSEPFVWLSYNEVLDRSVDVAFAFRALGIPSGQSSIGIYSKNRPEWIIVEHASYAFSNVIVPLYDTLGSDACSFIINQTEISLVVCDTTEKALGLVKQRESCPTLRTIVVMEAALNDAAVQEAKAADIRLMTFAELEKIGREVTDRVPLQPPQPDDLATICFTSGTTGVPKGVMLSHGNVIADGTTLTYFKNVDLSSKDVMMSFLPLAHMFERVVQSVVYTEGGRVGFFRGDIRLLPDDIKTLRPRSSRSFRVMGEVGRSFFKKTLFDAAMSYKMREMHNGVVRNTSLVDQVVFKKIREGMGGRVKLMITGSAPLGANVLNFIRAAMGCTVVEGYGQTEAVACATITLEGDAVPGHVGVPIPSNAIKLVDVPELNYWAKENAGEVCIRGANVFKGYYKNPEQTREAIDADGWLHTGDIGRWTERGTLKIVDRKKHIFKLAQGEYIAVEKLESVYTMSPLVQQIFVDGHSLESYLVAVVVPDPDELLQWHKKETGKDCSLEEVCQDPKARAHVLKALAEQGKAGHLNSIEQIKVVHLEPTPWSVENGLLTPTLKSKRPQLKKKYEDVVTAMYANSK